MFLFQPAYWLIFTGLISLFFLLTQRKIFAVLLFICFAGWVFIYQLLIQGQGHNIRVDILLLAPVMLALAATSIAVTITGLLRQKS